MFDILAVLVLTVASGYADAQGFVHSARTWVDGRPVLPEMGKAAGALFIGMLCYWLAVRSLNQIKVVSPELQTLAWFAVTITGIAFISGDFFSWNVTNKVVALGIVAGTGWLLYSNA